MTLCIVQATLIAALAAPGFSLSWTHSVEKTTWTEEWRVEGDRLKAVSAAASSGTFRTAGSPGSTSASRCSIG